MKFYNYFVIIGFLGCLIQCKNTSGNQTQSDQILSEALRIQDEAIHIGIEVDSILDVRLAEGAYARNIDSLKLLKTTVLNWRYNMVEIPGAAHDHTHHNHEGHHHDHDGGSAANLTPEEIKKVQSEWKTAIEEIRNGLKLEY
ncbi:MAG: hypothetical protein H7X99_00275 [Saprospiraceae bacterium]|nr:hypothetical protein [Saprospiraceae bacterium]